MNSCDVCGEEAEELGTWRMVRDGEPILLRGRHMVRYGEPMLAARGLGMRLCGPCVAAFRRVDLVTIAQRVALRHGWHIDINPFGGRQEEQHG